MPSKPTIISLFGVPFDANSSYMRGAAEAPARIREAFQCDSSNTWSENQVNIAEHLHDQGDVIFEQNTDPLEQITRFAHGVYSSRQSAIALGGDHSVTYALLKAVAQIHGPLNVVHFDAHADLYDEFQGSRYSHACPFARIMEDGLARRLVQVGIRTLNAHQKQQAEKFGVEICAMKDMKAWTGNLPQPEPPIYISFDMDVLDPAFAPGVSHHEPGGMSVRDVLDILQNIAGPMVGADIVELNPRRDPSGITAMCAAKVMKEIAAVMLQPGRG